MDVSLQTKVFVYQPDMLSQFMEATARVALATNSGEVTALLAEAAACVGADAAVFASLMRDDDSWQSYRFIVAGDANWCLEYEAGRCYLHDPWLRYARHSSEPMLAESIARHSPREAEVAALAGRYGFASALVIPAHSPQGLTRLGALCLGSRQTGYFCSADLQKVTFVATPLALCLHDWQIGQLRRQLLERSNLSDDDLVLLRHQRQGHGSKEIGRAIDCSAPSVDSRWQRLNTKLGVTSRAAAANLAAEYGLI